MYSSIRKIAVIFLCLVCSGCRRSQPPSGPAFDVPRLIGKDITEIRSILGPSSPAPPNLPPLPNANHDYKSWNKRGQWLSVEYSKSSGLVVGFTLGVDEQSESLKDEEKTNFLKTGNLKEADARYTIAFVEAGEVFRFTGVRITPQQSMHTVVLRVTEGSSLLQISYAVGTGSTPQSILTIPPWEYTTSATIDTPLSIEAIPFRKDGVSPSPNLKMTVQIIVNGKVLCENSSTGAAAKCEITL
jgi:hypothetical protein